MTDNEIIKALKCCREFSDCDGCQYGYLRTGNGLCIYAMQKDALDLINRLKAENERLTEEVKGFDKFLAETDCSIKEIKSEAYKEFVTKAEEKSTNLKDCTGTEVVFTVDDLYDLLKEMVGKSK